MGREPPAEPGSWPRMDQRVEAEITHTLNVPIVERTAMANIMFGSQAESVVTK